MATVDLLARLLGPVQPGTPVTPLGVATAILVSFTLTALIAALYRHTHRGTFYTQDYVHTLMLLGMVVSAVIMVVGESVERAFAVFAALSIIRFRRSVAETRDIGFIFFAMAVGMAAGAHQYVLATTVTVVIGAAVLLISAVGAFAPTLPTHLLRIRMRDGLDCETLLRPSFSRLFARAELRALETVQGRTLTELRYAVVLCAGVSHGAVLAEIGSIEGVERILLLEPVPERDY